MVQNFSMGCYGGRRHRRFCHRSTRPKGCLARLACETHKQHNREHKLEIRQTDAKRFFFCLFGGRQTELAKTLPL